VAVRVSLMERVSIEADGAVVDEQRFPGRQGRLVFAYLLAAHGRPVPRDELADALWGDEPPATWEKALSLLVSKLRTLLNECGVDGSVALTSAFGCYQLRLPPGTWIDVVAARDSAGVAERALADGALEQACDEASKAQALARRTFLPGEDGHWVEAQRAELRAILLRALECLAEAGLRSGEAAAAVRAAEEFVTLEPFRERGYRLLMEAHSAAGNDAEALRVYERCRRFLADELGAYPSAETETVYRRLLEGQPGEALQGPERAILDRDPALVVEPRASKSDWDASRRPRGTRTIAAFGASLAAIALVAVATGMLIDARAGGQDGARGAAASPRVAVVVPRRPSPEREDLFVTMFVDGIHQAERDYGVTAEIVVAPERRPQSRSFRRAIDRVRSGDFDLVISPAGPIMQALGSVAVEQPSSRFVVLGSPVDLPNATGYVFEDQDTGYLAGYLSGLMEARDAPRLNGARVLSTIGAFPDVGLEHVEGFREGARRAMPGVRLLMDNSNDFVDRSKCEAIANRHIDAGADIIFAAAGACSFGAFAAAEIRGVWAISVDTDRSHLGKHILASTVTRYDRVLLGAVRSFVNGTLPGGRTLVLGLDDDVVGIAGISPSVPESIRREVAQAAAALRRGDKP
jgi:basic membrane lipoprotein Med (substrate-binding protein (PBP1-ABC) superfamily)/DNA-binding SARP family transcriptional activator